MEHIETIDAMHAFSDACRDAGETVALVPTMGALHDGHLSLIRRAHEEADRVVTSVFVNPTQFGPDEDFESYPRDLEGDAAKLRALDVDALFAPAASEMYPHASDPDLPGPLTWVTVDELDETLCGAYRDAHFKGVTTVVTKLLNAVKPDVAVFGEKDAQQLAIIRRMVEDLLLDVEIVGAPIVREEDGLAMSSRNQYLTPSEREQATVLYEAVSAAKSAILGGEQDASRIVRAMRNALSDAPDARIQYVEVVDARTLRSLDHLQPGQTALAAVAVFFGDTRLIDNARATVPSTPDA
jgi:pantoate--beta-alanine ligase